MQVERMLATKHILKWRKAVSNKVHCVSFVAIDLLVATVITEPRTTMIKSSHEYAHIVQFSSIQPMYCSQACASNYKRIQLLLIFPPIFMLFIRNFLRWLCKANDIESTHHSMEIIKNWCRQNCFYKFTHFFCCHVCKTINRVITIMFQTLLLTIVTFICSQTIKTFTQYNFYIQFPSIQFDLLLSGNCS